jgi:leucyl/phenylalanyl-tRNA--protein transferase
VTVDAGFTEVMRACADRRRPDGWIDDSFVEAYTRLHELGWAHSIEVWSARESEEPRVVGGVYGVAIGGLFAGESMFHTETDASKVALVALVERLRAGGGVLLDVQWVTPHLASLGAVAIPRATYLELLHDAITHPQTTAFD